MTKSNLVDLCGQWRVAPVTPELRRSGADPDLDDSSWPELTVPGHWGQLSDLDHYDGAVLYRRQFNLAETTASQARLWLSFDGIIASSDVWLDGGYVGHTNGYFVPHSFDVTEQLRSGGHHTLSVEVEANDQRHTRTKRSLTGSLQEGPLAPPENPGGIWRPVKIHQTGPVAIRHSRLLCLKANDRQATLSFRLVLDSATAGEITILTGITSPEGQAVAGDSVVHEVAKGENHLDWTVIVEDPELWWPASLGEQPLYDVSVAVRSNAEGGSPDGDADSGFVVNELSDRCHWRTGLRTIDVDNFSWRVNGTKLFVKGISIGPQSPFLGSVDEQRIRDDVAAAATAGLDMIRVHGHVAPEALYEEANERGLLIWQDLPLVGGYATSARKAARAIAREAVDLLGHHPAVALWCAHDEPNGQALPEPGFRLDEKPPSFGRSLSRHLLPSWNRSVLDPIIRRELSAADRSRTVISRSGSLPMLTDTSNSDAHLWLGWHNGVFSDLAEVLKSWPKLGLFLGGFGSQSVVIRDWDSDEPTWPTAQTGAFERYIPRRAYGDGRSWAGASQSYQADLIRSQIETLRRLKYRPAGGFCLMALADAEPSGGFGVLSYDRLPKPAYEALTDACRPVIIVTETPPSVTSAGEELSFDVHAISDLQHDLGEVEIRATAHCGQWQHKTAWTGTLAADTCELIGVLKFVVPDLNGQLTVDLELRAKDWVATNRYQTVIIPPSETLRPTSVS